MGMVKTDNAGINMKVTNPEKILVLRLGGIGDAIISLPALRALREALPKSKITIACQSWLKEIFQMENIADAFIVHDALFSAGTRDLLKPRVWKEILSLSKYLLKEKWDILIAFHTLYTFKECLKPLLFSLLSRAKIRVGMDGGGRGWFLNRRVRYNRYGKRHYTHILADTVELLGIEVKDRKPRLNLKEEEKEWARDFLSRNGRGNGLLIGFCPGGRRKTRWWEPERYARVLKWMNEEYGDCDFLLTIGKGEDETERFFQERLGERLIVAKGQPIRYLAGVIGNCDLFISNDTGPMHLAVALDVPTIGLFGPGEWQKLAYDHDNFFPIYKIVDCWPCYKDVCDKGHKCMRNISVEEVIEKVKKALNLR